MLGRLASRSRPWRWADALALALALCLSGAAAHAADEPNCQVPPELLASTAGLPRLASKLAFGQGARIVAIGSSSTAGAGASSEQNNYPNQLQAQLRARFPKQAIEVINKGVNGEDAATNLARFSPDVLSLDPDLVIWQTGTNLALRGADPEWFRMMLRSGLDLLAQRGIDAILMAPQFAPRFNDTVRRRQFIGVVAAVAAERRVVLFDRYHIMKWWVDSGQMGYADFLRADSLHLNDIGYGCVAARLTDQIVNLTTRRD